MSAYFPEIRKSVKIPNIMSLFKFNYQLDELVKIYLHIKSKFHPPKAVQRLDWARISSRIRIHLQQVNYLLFVLHYLNCKRWWKQTIDTNENHDTVPLMSNFGQGFWLIKKTTQKCLTIYSPQIATVLGLIQTKSRSCSYRSNCKEFIQIWLISLLSPPQSRDYGTLPKNKL